MGDGRIFVGEESVDGVAGVCRVDLLNAVGVVEAAFVAEMAGEVEDEDMGRGLRTVSAGDGLRFAIVEIGIGEVLPGNADFHFLESIGDVGGIEFIDAESVGVVGLNDDDGDALGSVGVEELLDALLVHLGDRTVIAGEDDGEDGAGGVVGEGVGVAVDAGEREIGSGGADGEDGVVEVSGLRGGEDGSEEKKQEADGFHGPSR